MQSWSKPVVAVKDDKVTGYQLITQFRQLSDHQPPFGGGGARVLVQLLPRAVPQSAHLCVSLPPAGGIMKCDVIASGIVNAARQVRGVGAACIGSIGA